MSLSQAAQIYGAVFALSFLFLGVFGTTFVVLEHKHMIETGELPHGDACVGAVAVLLLMSLVVSAIWPIIPVAALWAFLDTIIRG